MENTYFALRHALEYAVVGARGAPLYRFKRGEPLAVVVPEDIRKFRGQPDLFFECDEKGVARIPAAANGPIQAPKSFKAFQPEPAAMPRETPRPPAPAPTPTPAVAPPPAPAPMPVPPPPPAPGKP